SGSSTTGRSGPGGWGRSAAPASGAGATRTRPPWWPSSSPGSWRSPGSGGGPRTGGPRPAGRGWPPAGSATGPRRAPAGARQAVAVQQVLAAEFPDDPRYRLDLVASRRGLAVLRSVNGRGPEGEQTLRELADESARLAAEHPDLAAARVEWFETLFKLGVIR